MREISDEELQLVSGGGAGDAAAAAGLAAGIGTLALGGAGWGGLTVAAAFAMSPLAVVAVVGLAAYTGYQLANK